MQYSIHLSEWIDWAIRGVIGFLCLQLLQTFKDIRQSLLDMKNSVVDLNNHMSVMIERTSHHSVEIERLDGRISRVEDKL